MAMQITDIDYLLAVEQGGSISRAADLLGISQPALTKAIRRIETDIGLRLFERTAKGVVATEAGHAFLRRAGRISLEYEDAMQEMQQMRTGDLGVLRLGFSRTVNERMVFDVCKKLLRERPAARFRLRESLSGELLPMLRAGELDLVLAPVPKGQSIDMAFVPLYDDRLHVVAMDSHPLRRRPRLSVRDLADTEWMVPHTDTKVRHQIDDMFRRHGLDGPRIRIETDFGSLLTYRLIQGTELLSICGDETLDKLEPMGLTPLAIADAGFARSIGIMHRPDGYLSPLTQRIVELFRQSVPDAVERVAGRGD
jgi:DNA-binding transcriptional LysR family regulator